MTEHGPRVYVCEQVREVERLHRGGSTVLGLLVKSDHPAKAGVVDHVRRVLEAAGAKPN